MKKIMLLLVPISAFAMDSPSDGNIQSELFEVRGYSIRTMVEVFNDEREHDWDKISKSTVASIIKPWRVERQLAKAA